MHTVHGKSIGEAAALFSATGATDCCADVETVLARTLVLQVCECHRCNRLQQLQHTCTFCTLVLQACECLLKNMP